MRRLEGRQPPVVVFSGTIASALEVRSSATLGVAGYVNEYTSVQHIVPRWRRTCSRHLHRRSSRAPASAFRSPTVSATRSRALTLNISRGGLAIRTTSPLDLARLIKLRFRLPRARPTSAAKRASSGSIARRDGRPVHLDRRSDQAAIAISFSALLSNRKA
jgi:hypothetical protein